MTTNKQRTISETRTERSTEVQVATATTTATAEKEQHGRTSNKPLPAGSVIPAIRSAPAARDVSTNDERDVRLFIRLATVALREDGVTCLVDLIEAVKCRCARARIPYGRGEIITAAIARLDRDRRLSFPAKRREAPASLRPAIRPLTRSEARCILAELGAHGLLRPMTRTEG